MRRDLNLLGGICFQASMAIRSSVLYRALTQTHGPVEVWPSLCEPGDGWSYFWLVAQPEGVVKGLAFVRYCCDTGQLQEQIEGPFRYELWVDVELAPAGGS
jgi:hypothetical protein